MADAPREPDVCATCGMFSRVHGCEPGSCKTPEGQRFPNAPEPAAPEASAPRPHDRPGRCRYFDADCISPHEACAQRGCHRQAAAPAEPAPLVLSRPELGVASADQHPGPWTQDMEYGGQFFDANGDVVIQAHRDANGLPVILVSSPRVRALTEAAPEMEALLRRMSDALRATLQALPKSVKTYPPGAIEAAVDTAMFLEALDKRSRG